MSKLVHSLPQHYFPKIVHFTLYLKTDLKSIFRKDIFLFLWKNNKNPPTNILKFTKEAK